MEFMRVTKDGEVWFHPEIKTLDDLKVRLSKMMVEIKRKEEDDARKMTKFDKFKAWIGG